MPDEPQRTFSIYSLHCFLCRYSTAQPNARSSLFWCSKCFLNVFEDWTLFFLCVVLSCSVYCLACLTHKVSVFTCRSHGESPQFGVSSEMRCVVVDNLQKGLEFVPSGNYYCFPKLMLGNSRCPAGPLRLGRKCSCACELPKHTSQGTDCSGLLAPCVCVRGKQRTELVSKTEIGSKRGN